MLKTLQLGRNCALKVPCLCLGTMNFGQPGRGHQSDWTVGPDAARPLFKAAIDKGLFYFDTADAYGYGASEEVVGSLLRELLPREQYLIATKICSPMGPNPNEGGLSRKHVIEGVNASLRRLGLDYIDHLVIHRHPRVRGHSDAPIEEALEALHDVVKAGKVLYLGASSMFAWEFAELQLTAKMHGWTPFVSMQNHYNLIYREEEREMNPYCVKSGVALMPWSPLARGILTGTYQGGFAKGVTQRSQGRDRERTEKLYRGEQMWDIAARVAEVAAKHGRSSAEIALAWVLSKPGVVSPVVGVSRLEQLDQLVAATELTLEAADITYLEEPYRPLENLMSIGTS
jgi:aryl-alcohol dehydrogenase-like predicted oxidoreductase